MWELCTISDVQETAIQYLDTSNRPVSTIVGKEIASKSMQHSKADLNDTSDSIRVSLEDAETSCRLFVNKLDNMLLTLASISTSYDDVTSRTNSLMSNCENLLEQQHSIQTTVDALSKILIPFNELEDVAGALGIPLLRSGTSSSLSSAVSDFSGSAISTSTLDPRSPEFQQILARLSKARSFLREHSDFKDSEKYDKWLEELQTRASSLVAQTMRSLLQSAARACRETKRSSSNLHTVTDGSSEELPLESAPVYQKFRGLGSRMRELTALLLSGRVNGAERCTGDDGDGESPAGPYDKYKNSKRHYSSSDRPQAVEAERDVLGEVKADFVSLRLELLRSLVKESALAGLLKSDGGSQLGSHGHDHVRHAYSTCLRIAQLEQKLFDSLFTPSIAADEIVAETGNAPAKPGALPQMHSSEVLSVVESVCNWVGDALRIRIIHDSDVDDLCRVATALAEDVRAQINSLKAPKAIVRQLLRGVERTVSDTQERLSYCAEARLRHGVQLFEPSPAELAYPEILEEEQRDRQQAEPEEDEMGPLAVNEISRTWYPPLRTTLSLLSKLYGVVEMVCFEDIARRAVRECVNVLQVGADGVRRARPSHPQLHGDLFLVRHLLILREQLQPFEIRLQSVEKSLDFKPTQSALNHLAKNTRNLWRFDYGNGLLQLAVDGLPATRETEIDAKRELDSQLKTACLSLKQSALRLVLGPVDRFLAKVTAFVGEIPTSSAGSRQGAAVGGGSSDYYNPLSTEHRASLRAQSFVRPDRIKEMLDSVQQANVQAIPELRDIMKLYIENSLARSILSKPIQQEVDAAKLKMGMIISSCVDIEHVRIELETSLSSVINNILTELSR